jgi:hypothetical protein
MWREPRSNERGPAKQGSRAVARMWARMTRMAIATALCLLVHGCDDVRGGAVELSWKLRPASSNETDKFVECGDARVTSIRLEWNVEGTLGFQQFDCDDEYGVTKFDLPAGTALLTVAPGCGELGELALGGTYIAPPPEQRSVIVGDIVSLGAVELVVRVDSCGVQPCICF